LHVVGTGNFTDDIYIGVTGRVCTENNGLCPSGGGPDSTAGWVNTSTQTSTSLEVNITGDFYIRNETGGNALMFLDTTTGHLGIGTAPTLASQLIVSNNNIANTIFTVQSNFSGKKALVVLSNINATTGGLVGTLLFAGFDNNSNEATYGGIDVQADNVTDGNELGSIIFRVQNSSTITEVMRILNSGYIGINTTNPVQTLHVVGTGNFTDDVYVGLGGRVCTENNGLCPGGGGGARSYGWSNTSTVVSLTDANDNVSAGVLLVDNDNNKVGVNTTDPVQTLHVVGTGNFTDDIYIGVTGRVCTENNGLCPGNADGNGGWVNNTAQTSTELDVNVTGDFYVRSITDTIIFIDASSGNIGINTTSPTHTLTLIGAANFTDDLNLETNLTVRGGGIFDDGGTPKIQFTSTKVIIKLG